MQLLVNTILLLISIVSFPANAVVSDGEEEQRSPQAMMAELCPDAFSEKDGIILPKPFSMTICPQDKAIAMTLLHFPATMETVINLLGLKHSGKILDFVAAKHISDNNNIGDIAGGGSQYSNDILNIERASLKLQELALLIIKWMIAFQVMILAFSGMRNGSLGGKSFINYKTTSKFAVGMILITPITTYSTLVDGELDILLIQLIIGGFTIVGIAFANMAISTIAYVVMNELPDARDLTFVDQYKDGDFAAIPLTKTRILIEDALCQNQSALVSVYEAAAYYNTGSQDILERLGVSYEYSTLGDGIVTWAETTELMAGVDITKGIEIAKGVGLDVIGDGKPSALRKTCSKTVILKPLHGQSALVNDANKISPSNPFGSVNAKDLFQDIELRVDRRIPFEHLGDIEKLKEQWMKIEVAFFDQYRAIKEKGFISEDVSYYESDVASYANYFYDSALYKAKGEDLINQIPAAFELYKNRAKSADLFAKTILAQRCYDDRTAYIRTKSTVESLLNGNIGGAEFSLECAQVNDTGLSIAFDADPATLVSYITDTVALKYKSNTSLQEQYLSIFKSVEGLEMQIEKARSETIKALTKKIYYSDGNSDHGFNNIMAQGAKLRVMGFAYFAHSYSALLESLHSVFLSTVVVGGVTSYSMQENANIYYSSDTNYLPVSVKEISSIQNSEKVTIPEFVFATPTTSKSNSANYEATAVAGFVSQVTTSQGGTYNQGGQTNASDNDNSSLITEVLGTSSNDGVVSVGIASIGNIVAAVYEKLGATNKGGEVRDAVLIQKVAEACGRGYTEKQLIEELGENGVYLHNSICPSYVVHPIFKSKAVGLDLIEKAVIIMTLHGVNRAVPAVTSKYKFLKNKRDEIKAGSIKSTTQKQHNARTEQAADAASDKTKMAIFKDIGKGFLNVMQSKIFNTMTFYLVACLGTLGMGMAFIAPLIPIMTYFFSYLGWIILFIQMMTVASFVALTLFSMTSDGDITGSQEKAFNGVFINLLFRPFAMIVGFVVAFILTYVSFLVYDLAAQNLISGLGTGDFGWSPFKVIMDLMMIIILWMGQLFLLKSIFEVSMKSPNLIIKKLGGSTTDAKEAQISQLAYAAASDLYMKRPTQSDPDLAEMKSISDKDLSDKLSNFFRDGTDVLPPDQGATGDDTTTKAGTGDDTTAKAGTGDDTKTKAGTGDDTTTKAGTGDDTTAKAGTGDDTTTKAGTGDDTTTKVGTGDDTTTKVGTGDDTTTKVGTGDDTTTKAGTGDDTTTKAGTGDDTTTKAGTGDDTTTKAGTGDDTTTKAGTGDDTTTKAGTGDDTTTKAGTGDDTKTKGDKK